MQSTKKASEQDSAAQKNNYKFTIIITAIIIKPEVGDTQGTRKKLGFKNIVREVVDLYTCLLICYFSLFLGMSLLLYVFPPKLTAEMTLDGRRKCSLEGKLARTDYSISIYRFI